MRTEDLRLGLRLSRQAGWNQIESDWRRFMNMEPEGCFVAELDSRPAGTTTTCILGATAWIAMVLVDESSRRKGIGTALLKHALDYLDARRIKTIRLDATSAGRPVYEKLGFVPEYELARFEGTPQPVESSPATIEAPSEIYADIIEFDRKITGTNREKLLGSLFAEFPRNVRILRHRDTMDGFITMRPGANAIQIGPCTATANAGAALLADALGRCAGKAVFVDMPTGNVSAVGIAESSGLKIQRRFTRMCRGERIEDKPENIWAGSGPEKG